MTENPDSDYISAINRRAAVRLGAATAAKDEKADTNVEKTSMTEEMKFFDFKSSNDAHVNARIFAMYDLLYTQMSIVKIL